MVYHSNTYHIKVAEAVPLEQKIENQETKYYKFVNEDPSIESISLGLNIHHGDADLYASRVDRYPDEKQFEKQSNLIGLLSDYVEFDSQDGVLVGKTYYIAVKA